jgi:hypothetical protein
VAKRTTKMARRDSVAHGATLGIVDGN